MRFMKSLALACAVGAAFVVQAPAALADDWADSLSYRPFARQASPAQAPARRARPAATEQRERTARTSRRPARTERAERAPRGERPQRTARTSPKASPSGYVQHGVASFYWQPQRVASGGWFNPNAMTAAHKTLPFGTRVRVTHLGNGRSVEVVINDRGPYIAGRIIDLSKAAAGVINMQGQGIAQVRMEVLGR